MMESLDSCPDSSALVINQMENCDWVSRIEDWRWDGVALKEILLRLDVISQHFSGMHRDWAHTVPEHYRGYAHFVSSSNPVNSEQEIRRCVEIWAVDQSGLALVNQFTSDTYLGVDYDESQKVMLLGDAQALMDDTRERYRKQEAGEDEVREDWALVGWDQSW